MPQDVNLKARGLHLSANPYSGVPQGGMVKADNCVIPFRDVLESRRGQKRLSYEFGAADDRSNEGHFWQDTLFIHYGASTLARDTGAAFTDLIGTYTPPNPDVLRMKFAELVKRLFFTTDAGIYVLDTTTGTPSLAGVPRPLDFDPIASDLFPSLGTHLTGNPGDGWMAKDSAVGIKAVFGQKDANGIVKLSAPSGRFVLTNPADVVVPIGGLVRVGTTVTVTVTSHGFKDGDIVSVSPGEANFPVGNKTITSITTTTFTYEEAGAAVASGAEQTLSSGAKNVQVAVILPSGVTTSHFVRLCRTETVAGAAEDPGDEYFTAYERYLTAADFSAGFALLTDKTPDAFLGPPLYTNPNTGDGSLQANDRPPIARDIHVFDGRLWAAQTTDKHRLFLRVLGCGAPDGLQGGDRIAVGPRVFDLTGLVRTEYTPAKNIELTLSNFIYRNNATAGIAAYAFAVTDGDSPTGQILFEEIGLGGAAFYAATSRTSAFQDPLPALIGVTEASSSRTGSTVTVTTGASHGFTAGQQVYLACVGAGDANFAPGLKTVATVPGATSFTYTEAGTAATMTGDYSVYATTYGSDNFRKPLRFSKQGEPESWPLTFYPEGLPDNLDVLRIHEHRGKLYVFFDGGDIYTVSGRYPYYVERFDGTATLVAADSLQEHSNRLYCLSTQGVVAISDSGVQIVSSEVESELLELFGGAMTEVVQHAFAVSYESDRQYQLWLPSAAGDESATQALVYNSLFGQWTRWTGNRTWGRVRRSTNLLYLGDADDNTVRQERKAYARSDYADEELPVTISAASGRVVTLNTVAGITVGDLLYQSDSQKALITAIDAANSQVTVLSTESWTTSSSAAVHVAIDCAAKWSPSHGGAPGLEKQWRDCCFHFNKFYVHACTTTFDTEKNTTERSVPLTQEGFGISAFGAGLFGLEVGAKNKRADVPPAYVTAAQLRVGFTVREAWALWSSNGYTLNFEATTERTGA